MHPYIENIEPITILMVNDDPDDRLMAQEAFEENRRANVLKFVNNGEELIQYPEQKGPFNAEIAPLTELILPDLNIPKKDGRTALKEIKGNPKLRRILVVVPTPSKFEEDVFRSHHLGVSSFITKPVTFSDLEKVTKEIGSYWFGIFVLPYKK